MMKLLSIVVFKTLALCLTGLRQKIISSVEYDKRQIRQRSSHKMIALQQIK